MHRFFFILFVLLTLTGPARAEKIQMQAIIYPPLVFEVDGQLHGVAPEVVKAIQAKVDDKNPLQVAPWLRAYKQTQEAKRKALFAIVRIPERENLFKWVGPIFGEEDFFFKRKGAPLAAKTLEDAKKIERIAVRKNGYTHQTLTAQGFTNLDVSPTYDSSYKKLVQGRVDLVLMGERTYVYMVKKAGLNPDEFEKTSIKVNKSTAWLAFSKDIPDEMITRWQKALDELKADGTYQAILKKNFGQEIATTN